MLFFHLESKYVFMFYGLEFTHNDEIVVYVILIVT